jgi:CRP/FNR family cyclic AMP-dependent transcriptional regulator
LHSGQKRNFVLRVTTAHSKDLAGVAGRFGKRREDIMRSAITVDISSKTFHAAVALRQRTTQAGVSRIGRIAPGPAAVSASNLSKFDPQTFLETAGAGRAMRKYKSTEIVFRQGDVADAVYYICSGTVKIAVLSDQGKEGVIGSLSAGSFLGEGCLAGQLCQLATATATMGSVIVKVEKAAMARVLRDEPALAAMFMSFLLARNIKVESDLVDQLMNSSEKRLARLLLALNGADSDAIIPRINQESLASQVGTTRSRINFFMNKFRKAGFIDYDNGGLRIHAALLAVVTPSMPMNDAHGLRAA